jgi:catechol 2,3-dioxygenase-like lactoylglutathione lyase family enzyme
MKVGSILESALYVDDLDRSARFYETVFGFERVDGSERLCALRVADRQLLLLFKRGTSADHDGRGRLHLAFAVAAADLDAWEARLGRHGVPIESRKSWERGGRSVYFRDPDDHLLELATPGTWAVY